MIRPASRGVAAVVAVVAACACCQGALMGHRADVCCVVRNMGNITLVITVGCDWPPVFPCDVSRSGWAGLRWPGSARRLTGRVESGPCLVGPAGCP